MATTADFKNGLCFVHQGVLYSVVSFQHVKPGKGGAFVRTKLKRMSDGRIIENTFKVGAKIDIARIERHSYQFLYQDHAGYHMMHQQTYEQIVLPKDILLSIADILKEGQDIEILFHTEAEKAIGCELPPHVSLKVMYTEPGVKGDTTSQALKQATLETGATFFVPLFVQKGDIISLDTRTKKYLSRVKQAPI